MPPGWVKGGARREEIRLDGNLWKKGGGESEERETQKVKDNVPKQDESESLSYGEEDRKIHILSFSSDLQHGELRSHWSYYYTYSITSTD